MLLEEIRRICNKFEIIQLGEDPSCIYLKGKSLITVMFKTVTSDCKKFKQTVEPYVAIGQKRIPFSSGEELKKILDKVLLDQVGA